MVGHPKGGFFSSSASSPQGEISDEQEIIQGKAIADSALAAGVSHLVYSSSGAAGKGPTGMGISTASRK